jgi:DNA primase
LAAASILIAPSRDSQHARSPGLARSSTWVPRCRVDPRRSHGLLDEPVAVPLHWEELSDRTLRPDRWTVKNVSARLAGADPWAGINRHARVLPRGVPSTAS